MSKCIVLSAAGLLLGAAVPFLSPPAIAQVDQVGEQIYTSCEHRFAVIFPGQPKTRDFQFTTTGGRNVPAREYLFKDAPDRFAVTVAVFPDNSPVVDDAVVEHAAEQIRQKGGRINQQFKEPYDPGMPGRQINISYPNGKQLRASVYMADRRMTITEATAAESDFNALQFEQSITLIDSKGNDLDRPNNNDPPRNFGCRS
jgi:hypothetical protein